METTQMQLNLTDDEREDIRFALAREAEQHEDCGRLEQAERLRRLARKVTTTPRRDQQPDCDCPIPGTPCPMCWRNLQYFSPSGKGHSACDHCNTYWDCSPWWVVTSRTDRSEGEDR